MAGPKADDGLGETGLAETLAETGLATTRPSAPRLPAGNVFGRYKVESLVAAGGMGVVYRAHDPELGRLVALKVVRPGGDDTQSSSRGRLVREAKAMARLAHPNVIVVHDAGAVGEDVFVAMELVDGEDLGLWERSAKRSWREIVDVYLQAARGLAAAHRAGLVHRDFKPANAILGRDGRVRVLDFGLARTVDEASEARGRLSAAQLALTQTGAIMGTPQFMSPEQHLGETVDARTDQFSMCVALYHALYGTFPFAGTTYTALATAVTEGEPTSPPRTTKVPPAIGKVVMRGLARTPEGRFASVDDMIAALERARARRTWPYVALGVGALAVATTLFVLLRNSSAPAQTRDLGQHMQDVTQAGEPLSAPDLSPDGKRLAWASATGLAIRDLATGVTKDIPDEHSMWSIRWSRAGDRILSTTDHGATVFDPTTGSVRLYNQKISTVLCHSAWSPDGSQILWQCDGDPSNWSLIDVSTGATSPLHIALSKEQVIVDCDWSPTGIAISTYSDSAEAGLWVASADGTGLHRVHAETGLGSVRWNASGTRLFFAHQTDQSFEIGYFEIASARRVVVLAQPQGEFIREPMFTVSRDERTVFYVQQRIRDDVVQQAVAGGEPRFLTVDRRLKTALARSSDGTQIAFAAGTPSYKRVFVMTRATGALREIDVPASDIQTIAFSPAGTELAFTSLEPAPRMTIVLLGQGGPKPRVLEVGPFSPRPFVWATTGSLVVPTDTLTNLLLVDPQTGAARPMFDHEMPDLTFSAIAPDASKIASTVATSDYTAALISATAPHGDRTVLASATSANPLAWSHDGASVIASQQPPDDDHLRITATSAAGDGRSRLLGVFSAGSYPIFLDDEATVAWISHTAATDIWMASADAHPPLPQGPLRTPQPRAAPVAFAPALVNLELAGKVGEVPSGWESTGFVTGDCGRPGTCVVLDGASRASIGQRVDATEYRGRRLQMTFDAAIDGGATLFIGVNSGIYASSLLPSGQLVLTDQAWTHHEMFVDVAPDATYIELKALATRAGRARVANFAVALVP